MIGGSIPNLRLPPENHLITPVTVFVDQHQGLITDECNTE
ncbi:hypothetical protein TOL_1236 [Thalassolituus oleivorans MIL-1]|uniref:Uncharacterized protein n=1 Tax=Thalassolituus oleivorans MIL-1 TaxID=1298593 RepID=M5E259_9GAMM|nr:hypothetical protein TOL_1236 [Thalassolituus oleivorans MIL-1]